MLKKRNSDMVDVFRGNLKIMLAFMEAKMTRLYKRNEVEEVEAHDLRALCNSMEISVYSSMPEDEGLNLDEFIKGIGSTAKTHYDKWRELFCQTSRNIRKSNLKLTFRTYLGVDQ